MKTPIGFTMLLARGSSEHGRTCKAGRPARIATAKNTAGNRHRPAAAASMNRVLIAAQQSEAKWPITHAA